eukprot:SAG22_NODE_16344_length_327_cov_0.846491_1_plen_82_part_01
MHHLRPGRTEPRFRPPRACAIRTCGLLKFMRNVGYAHRYQHVAMGSFSSEEQLMSWLLEPFPWLLMVVWRTVDQSVPDWRND